MIINHRHKLVFMHIPKCGGTSIRGVLERLDDGQARFDRAFEKGELGSEYVVPDVGVVNYKHIPLRLMARAFPGELEALRTYKSFATVRSPLDRFRSSVSQYVKRHVSKSSILDPKDVERSIPRLLSELRRGEASGGGNGRVDTTFLAFQPQVDFIYLDGERLVTTIHTMAELPRLLGDIVAYIGEDLGHDDELAPRENVSVTYRNAWFHRARKLARPVIRRLLPASARAALRDLAVVPRDGRLAPLFETPQVQDFVADFYRDDIALWEEVMNADEPATS